MKILYRQKKNSDESTAFTKIGIENCYLKYISTKSDSERITPKEHRHTDFEVHIIVSGSQKYYIDGKTCEIKENSFLIIAPGVSHRVEKSKENTKKYSLTFSLNDYENKLFFGKYLSKPVLKNVTDCCTAVYDEYCLKKEFSKNIIENRVYEIIVSLLRLIGITEKATIDDVSDANVRVEMAKLYINDNITSDISVKEVSKYCYVGERQLTRLFLRFEGKSPGTYIREQKIKRIEELIISGERSFKEIASYMNFNNEYYLNTFFKKYYGMPPGEYRKMQSGENKPD